MVMRPSVAAGAARRAPHAEPARLRGIGDDHRRRQLDHDRHVVEATDVVEGLASRAKRVRCWRVRKRREVSTHRLPIRYDAKELLEVDEEWIVARSGKELNAAR